MAKKKGPGGPAMSGAEKQRRKQERIEQRRQERAAAALAAQRRARRERIVRIIFIAALGFAAFWFFFLRGQTPSEIRGHEIQKFAVGPAGTHRSGTLSYEMTPPVGGPHAPNPAPCGVHPTRIPNETMVHSLEHGAVGLLFDPTQASEEQVRELESIVGDHRRNLFSAPFPGMETPIAVVSWGEMMRLDDVDEAAIREYIDEFAGKGPEPGQECPKAIEQPFDFATPAPTPAPSPTAGESPGEEEAPSPQPEES